MIKEKILKIFSEVPKLSAKTILCRIFQRGSSGPHQLNKSWYKHIELTEKLRQYNTNKLEVNRPQSHPSQMRKNMNQFFRLRFLQVLLLSFFALFFRLGLGTFFFFFSQLGLPQPLHTLVLFVVSFLQNFSLVKKNVLTKWWYIFHNRKKDCTYSPIKTNKMKVFPWKNKTMDGLRARYEVGHFSSFFPFFGAKQWLSPQHKYCNICS